MKVAHLSCVVFVLVQAASMQVVAAEPASGGWSEKASAEASSEGAAPAEDSSEKAAASTGAASSGQAAPAAEPVVLEEEPAEEAPAAAPAALSGMTEPAPPPLKLETPSSSLKLGVLFQPQFEVAGSPTLDGVSQNLFVRRVRFLLTATVFKNIEFFFDTDYPDLFKAAQDTGIKNTPGLNVQDAFGTFKAVGDMLKIDMGYMLPPSTHNANQGAGTLYGWDYFTNSFRNSNSFNSSGPPVGRDAGVQLRGLVLEDHFEYRLGLFQGRRNAASADGHVGGSNAFRFAARAQVNVFDPEIGFFYAGTYLGTKRVLSFGGTVDIQDEYIHWGADGFLDLPVGPGLVTAQVNFAHYDGGDFIVAGGISTPLAEQNDFMGEAGYLFDAIDLSPIFRFERQTVETTDTHETRVGGGLAYWPYGHAFNVKAFLTRVTPDAADQHSYNQFNLQTQVYVF